jgi:hypothetical protein
MEYMVFNHYCVPISICDSFRMNLLVSISPVLKSALKVLTNEKRGGLAVVPFDRSRFKLVPQKFSNKLVQAPSCERHKTAPRTLFLLFANYNCFPIALLCRDATHFSHHTII